MLGFAKKKNDGYYPAEVSIYFKFELVHVIPGIERFLSLALYCGNNHYDIMGIGTFEPPAG